ncbi:B9 domain [Trypanosoma melophagium]|uniref:B9 domain n=1 Tax=Trypanosoma melophagium TaxID=715481 RepID=UPI00351A8072|nr:B9 domain [Trypanosoma melophagium]
MDILRFYSAQRYASRVSLYDLSFCITVWRAPLVEEEHTETLCSVTVPWNGKVLSPAEKLEMIRAAASMAEGKDVNQRGESSGTGGEEDEMEMPSVQSLLLGGSGHVIPTAAEAMKELHAQLENPENALFTRPSNEDYIHQSEAECPVEPPQCPSPLAAVILRQHRKQHRPSNKMYFMWAVGRIVGAAGNSLNDMRWEGEERVICTIAAEQSEMYFTAKPSINETHTLYVDSLHVYSFNITVTTTEDSNTISSKIPNLIRKINRISLSAQDKLNLTHNARRDALQRMLLQQAIPLRSEEVGTDSVVKHTPNSSSTFTQSPSKGSVRYHIYGTLERCIGVPEDGLFLRCQWQYGNVDRYNEESENVIFTTQLASSGIIIVDDFIPLPVHTFNVPFEYHFEERVETTLRLIITVYSDEGVGAQQTPVGYTALTVPHFIPGRHTLRAALWRPRPTGREFLRSAFVGGGPSLVDARDAAPCGTGGISVKHGMLTESTGEIEVRLMVLQHRHQ